MPPETPRQKEMLAQAIASQLKHRANGTLNAETQIGHILMLANAYLDQHSRESLDGEEYLLSCGWDHVMTEADGCDSWSFPFGRRNEWPKWAKYMHGTQHFWDLDEAVELQRQLGNSTPSPKPLTPVDWPTEPGWWWIELTGLVGKDPMLCEWRDDEKHVRFSEHDVRSRGWCKAHSARFLRAVPTFPPREPA